MSRLIDADKLNDYFWDNRSKLFPSKDCMVAVDKQLTVNAIPIPEGATNGDVIKAMFPSSEVREIMDDLVHYTLDGYVGAYITKDWWNALYRIDEESEDEK